SQPRAGCRRRGVQACRRHAGRAADAVGPARAMKEPAQGHDTAARRSPAWGGYLLGFGMGGFFDGILLHQVLQWHHLLSAYQAGPLGDLRVQVMADGIFHVLMYVVAMAGLWGLYRARRAGPPTRRRLLAAFLVGFGIWHVVDAV